MLTEPRRRRLNPRRLLHHLMCWITAVVLLVDTVVPPGLLAQPVTVPDLNEPAFTSTDLDPYFELAKRSRTEAGWEFIVARGRAVLKAQWETSLDAQISSEIAGVSQSDHFNTTAEYQDYLRRELELQKQTAENQWELQAEAAIQSQRTSFLGELAARQLQETTQESEDDVRAGDATNQNVEETVNPSDLNQTQAALQEAAEELSEQERAWQQNFESNVETGLQQYNVALATLQQDYQSFLSTLSAKEQEFDQARQQIKAYENQVRTGIEQQVDALENQLNSSDLFYQQTCDGQDNCSVDRNQMTAAGQQLQTLIQQLRDGLQNDAPLSTLAQTMTTYLDAQKQAAEQERDQWQTEIRQVVNHNNMVDLRWAQLGLAGPTAVDRILGTQFGPAETSDFWNPAQGQPDFMTNPNCGLTLSEPAVTQPMGKYNLLIKGERNHYDCGVKSSVAANNVYGILVQQFDVNAAMNTPHLKAVADYHNSGDLSGVQNLMSEWRTIETVHNIDFAGTAGLTPPPSVSTPLYAQNCIQLGFGKGGARRFCHLDSASQSISNRGSFAQEGTAALYYTSRVTYTRKGQQFVGTGGENDPYKWNHSIFTYDWIVPEYFYNVNINYTAYNANAEHNRNVWDGYVADLGGVLTEWRDNILPAIQNWESQVAEYEGNYGAWKAEADAKRIEAETAYNEGRRSIISDRNRWLAQMDDEFREGRKDWNQIKIAFRERKNAIEQQAQRSGAPVEQLDAEFAQQSEEWLAAVRNNLPAGVASGVNAGQALGEARARMPRLKSDFLNRSRQGLPDVQNLAEFQKALNKSLKGSFNAALATEMNDRIITARQDMVDALQNALNPSQPITDEMLTTMLQNQEREVTDASKERLRQSILRQRERMGYDIEVGEDGSITARRGVPTGEFINRGGLLNTDPELYDPVTYEQSVYIAPPPVAQLASSGGLFDDFDAGEIVSGTFDNLAQAGEDFGAQFEDIQAKLENANGVARAGWRAYDDNVREEVAKNQFWKSVLESALQSMALGAPGSQALQSAVGGKVRGMVAGEIAEATGLPAGFIASILGGAKPHEAAMSYVEDQVLSNWAESSGIPKALLSKMWSDHKAKKEMKKARSDASKLKVEDVMTGGVTWVWRNAQHHKLGQQALSVVETAATAVLMTVGNIFGGAGSAIVAGYNAAKSAYLSAVNGGGQAMLNNIGATVAGIAVNSVVSSATGGVVSVSGNYDSENGYGGSISVAGGGFGVGVDFNEAGNTSVGVQIGESLNISGDADGVTLGIGDVAGGSLEFGYGEGGLSAGYSYSGGAYGENLDIGWSESGGFQGGVTHDDFLGGDAGLSFTQNDGLGVDYSNEDYGFEFSHSEHGGTDFGLTPDALGNIADLAGFDSINGYLGEMDDYGLGVGLTDDGLTLNTDYSQLLGNLGVDSSGIPVNWDLESTTNLGSGATDWDGSLSGEAGPEDNPYNWNLGVDEDGLTGDVSRGDTDLAEYNEDEGLTSPVYEGYAEQFEEYKDIIESLPDLTDNPLGEGPGGIPGELAGIILPGGQRPGGEPNPETFPPVTFPLPPPGAGTDEDEGPTPAPEEAGEEGPGFGQPAPVDPGESPDVGGGDEEDVPLERNLDVVGFGYDGKIEGKDTFIQDGLLYRLSKNPVSGNFVYTGEPFEDEEGRLVIVTYEDVGGSRGIVKNTWLADRDGRRTSARVAGQRQENASVNPDFWGVQRMAVLFQRNYKDWFWWLDPEYYRGEKDYGPQPPLGELSAKHESGSEGTAAVNLKWIAEEQRYVCNPADTLGGCSYGKYQIATKNGSMDFFFRIAKEKAPEYYKRLQAAGGVAAAKAGEARFIQAWKEMAAERDFQLLERQYIVETHYEPRLEDVLKIVPDMQDRHPVMKDIVYSLAVQHNKRTSTIIRRALNGQSPESMSDEELIRRIYAERSRVHVYFASSPRLWPSLRQRFEDEKNEALARLED